MESTLQTQPWSADERILFRFIFVFFGLYMLIFNNGAYPFFDVVMAYPTDLLHLFIPWVGQHILHLSYPITEFTNGSGDTTYDYVCLLCTFVTAIIACVVWTLADRKNRNYYRLYYWLTVAVRFYVGLMLVNYGFAKIFKSQFPTPGLGRLNQTYGSSSPMGLAWTFLGFSTGYNLFMGLAEVAALLLLFRKTVTLGAIISLMTAANVMAVNYFYDVPVKILSTSLVIFVLFLLTPNFITLFRLFIKNEPASLRIIGMPPATRKWLHYGMRGLKALTLLYLILVAYDSYSSLKEYGDSRPKPPLYGLYNISSFTIHGKDSVPAEKKWKQMIIEWPEFARVKLINDSSKAYTFIPDTLKHVIAIYPGEDSQKKSALRYEMHKDQLLLAGKLETDSVTIRLDKYDYKKFRLMNRGFHWISEYPYNR